LSCNLNCPTRGTAFQEPADAGYESYYAEWHPVYQDRPASFFSGQEFEPEMYKPVFKKPTAIPLFVKTDNFTTTNQHKVDFVPHILTTGLRIVQSRNK
jgi:hypothetical protein